MDHRDSSLTLFESCYEWWGSVVRSRRDKKYDKLLLSDEDDEESSPKPNKEKVSELSIYPPDRIISALCTIEERDNNNKTSSIKLQEDIVSLCIVGGLQAKIQQFCTEHGKAHGSSKKYYIIYGGSFIAFCLIFIPLLVQDSSWFKRYHIFAWFGIGFMVATLAEKAHRTSTKFLESKRKFWHAWKESGLESKLTTVLTECGYFFEVEAQKNLWKLSVFKKEEKALIRLPAPPSTKEGDEKDTDEETTQKYFGLFIKIGLFEHQHHDGNNARLESNGELPPSDPDIEAPFDLWTLRGLLLGRRLNTKEACPATSKFITVICVCYFAITIYDGFSSFVAYLAVVCIGFIFCVVAIRTFHEFYGMPKLHATNNDLASRLSPLISDRHDGYTLSYEIRPDIKLCRIFRCWKKGVFVIKKPAENGGGV